MKVDIYKAIESKIESSVWHVFLQTGVGLDTLPEKIKHAADHFSLNQSLEIAQGELRIALDTDEAISDISSKGYYIQGAKIEI